MNSTVRVTLIALCFALPLSTLGCAKADKDDCNKMTEHDYGILDKSTHMSETGAGKKLFDELKQKTMDACIGKMTKSAIDCHMKATTTAEMDKCDAK